MIKKTWNISKIRAGLTLILLLLITYDSISQNNNDNLAYHSVHYRSATTIHIEGQTFSGQLNVVNVIDSFLYLQFNVGAFEAGRFYATPDSVLFINKIQKNFYHGGYAFFQAIADIEIDFFTIQALLNNLPLAENEDITISYEGEIVADGRTFFRTLNFEHDSYPLEIMMDIKKITFNNVPKVNTSIPKNFSVFSF